MNFGLRKLSRDEINACLVCAQSTIATTLAIMREIDLKENQSNMSEKAHDRFKKIYIDLINLESSFSEIRGWNFPVDGNDS